MSLSKSKIKRRIIQRLQENFIVGHVCKQLSVARSTFYRWQEEDEQFKKAVKDAQELGRAMIFDAATSKTISIMNNGSDSDALKAAKIILNRYDPYYKKMNIGANYRINKLKDKIEKLEQEKSDEVDEAIKKINRLHDEIFKKTDMDDISN